MSTAWLVIGPPQHGVVILADQLTADLGDVVLHAATVDELLSQRDAWNGVVNAHVHFTDELFGSDCAAAATAYRVLANDLARAGVTLAVTLHDLPIDPDDPARYRRRAEAYAAVVAATTGAVIVSSSHEAAVLGSFASDVHPVAIPLPIDVALGPQSAPGPQSVGRTSSDVTILGYLYPGKGHLAAIEALTALPDRVGLTALGQVAEGHKQLADRLRARADELGRRFSITGWIPSQDLAAHLRVAGIPLVGHERLSASGSIGSWLSAGRRPLAPDVAYVRELADRLPGAIVPYPHTAQGLRTALSRAHHDPASTWLDPSTVLGPTTAEVRSAYRTAVPTVSSR